MFNILSRDTRFFNLMEQAASVMLGSAHMYAKMAHDYDKRNECVSRIRQYEHEGDEATHASLGLLDKTFITPFDREDIHTLMMRMDDVVDEIDAASKRFVLYDIPEPTIWFVKQADVLVEAATLLAEAMPRLRNLKHPDGLQEALVRVHDCENRGDDNNHAAVADLYRNQKDIILVLKWKEIYDLTERAIDATEDVANTIGAIVLKNT